jgi:hypothetical protein
MKRQKKILFVAAIIFVVAIIISTVDIMRRTTRPGAKKQLPGRIFQQ